MNRQFARFAALVLCAVLTACAKTNEGSRAAGARNPWTVPHVLRYTLGTSDVQTLNPWLSQDVVLGLLSSPTMAWLVKWDSHNAPVPELATQVPSSANGGVSKDGLAITYHLRKNVRWSDGAPFDADDVVWSIHAVLNPANDVVSRTGWDRIKKIDEPDKYTVVLHLSKPYSPFVQTFFSSGGANPCILPKHLLARYANINHLAYNALPVGIGPFKYKEWLRGQKVVLVANPLYWRGLPKLKEIDFEIITDRNTAAAQIRSHAIDLWYTVPGSYYTRMTNLPGIAAYKTPSYYFNHIDFNTQHSVVSDPVVRRALRYGIDRATLIAKIQRGIALLQDQPASQAAPYWDPTIKNTPYDPAMANQLLDADGWKRGPDGVRAKNGRALALDLVSSAGTPDVDRMLELIRQNWEQLGAQVNVKRYTNTLLFAPYNQGGIIYGGKFDVIFFAWSTDAVGDMSYLYACNQFPPNGQNDLRWCDPVADKAMHDLYTHYDQSERNKDVAILESRLDEEVPTIIQSGRYDTYLYNSDLKNFHPGAITQFDQLMDVDI